MARPLLGLLALTALAVGVAGYLSMAMISAIAYAQRGLILDASGEVSNGGLVLVLLEVGVPVLLMLAGLVAAVGVAVAQIADDAIAGRIPSARQAMARGVRRAPAVVAAFFVAALAVAGLAILTPFFMLYGAGGLLLGPVKRRLWPGGRWPSTRKLVVALIPLGPAAGAAVRWWLVLPAIALERHSPRRALSRSRNLVGAGISWAALMLLTVVAVQSLSGAVRSLVLASWVPDIAGIVATVLIQAIAFSLPIVIATVVFRALVPVSPDGLLLSDPPRRRPGTATALFLAFCLVAGLVLVGGDVAPAEAAAPVTSTVDDFGDLGDENPGDGVCRTAGGACTLRAAIEEANATVGKTNIRFARSGFISTDTGTIEVTAEVDIDGAGHRVALSGRGCSDCPPANQILRFTSATAPFRVANLRFIDGLAGASGGGAIHAVSPAAGSKIERASFGGHSSTGSGGAIAVDGGSLEIVNSTFSGNSSSAGGSHISNAGNLSIFYSTFVQSGGTSSIHNTGTMAVNSSIVAPAFGAACASSVAGNLTGAANLDTDGTCPDSARVGTLGSYADHGGSVPTVEIGLTSGAVDAGDGTSCALTGSVDARGETRPRGLGCDIGAYEYQGPSTYAFVVDDLGDAGDDSSTDDLCKTATGSCTLRAAVEQAAAEPLIPTTVTFGLSGTVTLASPLTVPGTFELSGAGREVVVSGGGTSPILRATGTGKTVGISDVTLTAASTADAAGGAALRSVASTTVSRVTFTGNAATSGPGGAVAVTGGSLTVENATFDGNSATSGADVHVSGGASATIRHTTTRGATGGSIAVAAGSSAAVSSSIVAPASGNACTGVASGSTNISPDSTCSGTVATSTGFGTLADHGGAVPTISLITSSPAIDAASSASCPATDARGIARPQAIGCDIGSFELEPVSAGVSFTVDDLGDVGDETPGDGACATGAGVCTLRAALEESAARTAASPITAPAYSVGFSVSGTVAVGSPLVIAAIITIDGAGQRVTLSGGGATNVLVASDLPWAYTLKHLTVADGATSDSSGGAGLRSSAPGTLDSVTFTANTATTTGSAAGGGAIAVLGRSLSMTNTTFSGNSATSAVGGADIYARGTVTVQSSTFHASTGTSVMVDADDPGSVTLYDSVFAPVSGGSACVGASTAGNRISGEGNFSSDGSCPGVGSDPKLGTLADRGGAVPTVNLLTGSPAIDAASAARCPAKDARGITRPQSTDCDAGAVEYAPSAVNVVVTTSSPSPYGSDVRITVEVGGTHEPIAGTGTVTLKEGTTTLATLTLAGGTASHVVSGWAPGDHTVDVSFPGDGTLPAGAGSVTHTVTPPSSAVTVTVSSFGRGTPSDTFVFTAEVGADGIPDVATGSVTFRDGTTLLGTIPLAGGQAMVTLVTMTVGAHTITAEYSGDAVFPAATGTLNHVVLAGSSVSLSGPTSPTVFGEQATFTAQVSTLAGFTPSGTVTFKDGTTTLGSVAVDGAGRADLVTAALPVGARSLTAAYDGDPSVAASDPSAPAAHIVGQAATTLAIASSSAPSVVGESVTLTATVTAVAPGGGVPTGTVTFVSGSVLLATVALDTAGKASTSTGSLPLGDHVVTAEYFGSSSHLGSSSTFTQTVGQAASTTALTSSVNPSTFGQSVTLTAAVAVSAPGNASIAGSVVFADGPTVLATVAVDGTGTATFTTAGLSAGTHDLRATFSGNADVASSAGTLTQEVAVSGTSTRLTASVASSVTGQDVTFTAVVTPAAPGMGDPTGTVTFTGFGLASPTAVALDPATSTAVITVPSPLGRGFSPSITAVYDGDGSFLTSTDSEYVRVDPAEVDVTMTASPTSPLYGQPVTVTVTVTPRSPGGGVPSGVVQIDSWGTFVRSVSGSGVFETTLSTTSDLGTYTHRLEATFSGSGYVTSSSPTVDVAVQPVQPDIVLSVTPTPSEIGEEITLTATLTVPDGAVGPWGRTVFFQDGSTSIGSATVRGSGVLTATLRVSRNLAVGVHSLTAAIASDSSFESATSAAVAHEVVGYPTEVGVFTSPTLVGEPVTVTVVVSNATSGFPRPTPVGRVDLRVDGALYRAPVTLPARPGSSQTLVTFEIEPLSLGAHEITSTFQPLGDFQSSAGGATHVVSRLRSDITLEVGAASVEWGRLLLVRSGVTSSSATASQQPRGVIVVSDGSGASCSIGAQGGSCYLAPMTPGIATITASYAGDDTYGPATSATRRVTVLRRPSSITASISGDVVEREPSVVTWRVDGPAGGTVQARIGDATCSGGVAGSCEGRFPAGSATRAQSIRLSYSGDTLYLPSTWSETVTPIACHRLQLRVVGEPATITAVTPTDCGDGYGYREGSLVRVDVVPVEQADDTFVWEGVDFDGIGFVRGPSASILVRVGTEPDRVTTVIARPQRSWNCFSVVLLPSVTVANSIRDVGGALRTVEAPNCPVDVDGNPVSPFLQRWEPGPEGRTGRFLAGSTVTLRPEAFAGMQFYGYDQGSGSFVVTAGVAVQAVFGPMCVDLRVEADGPGTAGASTPANCRNPITGLSGYREGTVVDLAARPDVGAYVPGWPSPTEVWAGRDQGWVVEYRQPVSIGSGSGTQTVTVDIERCRRISVEPVNAEGAPGTAVLLNGINPGNCPTDDDPELYVRGGRVVFEAVPSFSRFSRWGQSEGEEDQFRIIEVRTDEDLVLRPAFVWHSTTCGDLTVRVDDGLTGEVSMVGLDDSVCMPGTLNQGPAASLSGQYLRGTRRSDTVGFSLLRFEGRVEGTNALVGWSFDAPIGHRGRHGVEGTTAVVEAPATGSLTATLTTCVKVVPEITLVYPDGSQETGTAPVGTILPARPDFDVPGDLFLPDCPFGTNTYRVGSTAVFEPIIAEGYRFVRWEGDVEWTGEPVDICSPDDGCAAARDWVTAEFDGTRPRLTLRAVFDVVCHTVTVENAARVLSGTAPDCQPSTVTPPEGPGGSYVAGQTIRLYGRLPNGKLPSSSSRETDAHVWQGWTGDTGDLVDGRYSGTQCVPVYDADSEAYLDECSSTRYTNPIAVVIDGDRTVKFAYRETTGWEDFTNTMEDVGVGIVEGIRKGIGLAAMFAKDIVLEGVVGLLVDTPVLLARGINELLKAFGVDTKNFETYVEYAEQTSEYLMSGFDCAAVWAMSSGQTTEYNDGRRSDASRAVSTAGSVIEVTTRKAATADITIQRRTAFGVTVVPGGSLQGAYARSDQAANQARRILDSPTGGVGGVTSLERAADLSVSSRAQAQRAQQSAQRYRQVGLVAETGARALSIAGVGLQMADLHSKGHMAWDTDLSAWSNDELFMDCLESKVPDYWGIPRD